MPGEWAGLKVKELLCQPSAPQQLLIATTISPIRKQKLVEGGLRKWAKASHTVPSMLISACLVGVSDFSDGWGSQYS